MSTTETEAPVTTVTRTAALDAVLDAGASAKIVGEVIWWECHGTKSVAMVRAALTAAGFDAKKYAPDFKHLNVFARVAEKLEQAGRIIKRIRKEDSTYAHFQFNQSKFVKKDEAATTVAGAVGDEVNERVDYPFEDIITLGKETGAITCKDPDFKLHLEGQMDVTREQRTANDITCMIQKMFTDYEKSNRDADLFPLRSSGAVYFVLEKHKPFLDRVNDFVRAIPGSQFGRMPIAVGTDVGSMSIKDTIASGLDGLIHEFDMTVKSLDESSKKGTIDKTAKRIDELQLKIECYESYLGSAREKLLDNLAESKKKLKAKVIEIAMLAADEDEGEEGGKTEPTADPVLSA
jgi:hypothetical protein